MLAGFRMRFNMFSRRKNDLLYRQAGIIATIIRAYVARVTADDNFLNQERELGIFFQFASSDIHKLQIHNHEAY